MMNPTSSLSAVLLLLLLAIHQYHAQAWGTLRPGIYLGARQRSNTPSLVTGMAFFGLNDYAQLNHIRHQCNIEHTKFGYALHNGNDFANQSIVDTHQNLNLTTTWVSIKDHAWVMRVHGTPIDESFPASLALLYYAGFDGVGEHVLKPSPDGSVVSNSTAAPSPAINNESVSFVTGYSHAVGNFSMYIRTDQAIKPRIIPLDLGESSSGNTWNAVEHFAQLLTFHAQHVVSKFREKHGDGENFADHVKPMELFSLPPMDTSNSKADTAMSQINLDIGLGAASHEFTVDFIFVKHAAYPDQDPLDVATAIPITDLSLKRASQFMTHLDATFKVSDPLSVYAVSNLLGGIGYFYGSQVENMSPLNERDVFDWLYLADDDDEEAQGQHAAWKSAYDANTATSTVDRGLLTATPSRSFFPRGFLWDEGFHLLVIMRWDWQLGCDILHSWLDIQDTESGWIAREQILGDEARSRVPEKFQVQSPFIANPPTLMLAVEYLVSRLKSAPNGIFSDPTVQQQQLLPNKSSSTTDEQESILKFLKSIVPNLVKLWDWYQATQMGDAELLSSHSQLPTNEYVYRWRGRTLDHNFASGLDDYPRADPPNIGELHVDLTSWMAWYATAMHTLHTAVGLETPLKLVQASQMASDNVRSVFWSPSHGFGDLSYDLSDSDEPWQVYVRVGYVSVLPYVLGQVDSTLHPDQYKWSLNAITELSNNGFGVQSLHPEDPGTGKVDNYWRGNVWINWQYLILSRLFKDAKTDNSAAVLYKKIRADVLGVVKTAFDKNGYLYEHYNGVDGTPGGSHPFTGWTSLIVLINGELYH